MLVKLRMLFIPYLLAGAVIILPGCSAKKQDLYQNKTAVEIFTMGKEHTADGKYFDAIKDFEALEARYPYGEYAERAQLAIIYAHYKKGEMEHTLAAANRFIKLHPKHPHVDYAYYMLGMANYEDTYTLLYRRLPLDRSTRDPSQARKAFTAFKNLVEKFPNSKYAPDARQRMKHLKNQLANYEIYTANYYLQRKAYLAAANRAGFVITNFDQSAAIPEALEILYKAYRGMDKPQLAADVLNTLKQNYPKRIIKE